MFIEFPGGETIYNPNSEGITFWKWQWEIMINEIKQYHGG